MPTPHPASEGSWVAAFNQDWPADQRTLLPVHVLLRDFDAWLDKTAKLPDPATSRDLDEFIMRDLELHSMKFASRLLREALDAAAIYWPNARNLTARGKDKTIMHRHLYIRMWAYALGFAAPPPRGSKSQATPRSAKP